MNDEECAQARLTAQFLSTARLLAAVNALLFVLAVCRQTGGLLYIQAALFAVLLYLHIRLYFDVQIFFAFARKTLAPETFDHALAQTLRRQLAPRPLADRCRGALQLWKTTALLTALQLLLTVLQ